MLQQAGILNGKETEGVLWRAPDLEIAAGFLNRWIVLCSNSFYTARHIFLQSDQLFGTSDGRTRILARQVACQHSWQSCTARFPGPYLFTSALKYLVCTTNCSVLPTCRWPTTTMVATNALGYSVYLISLSLLEAKLGICIVSLL